jgi:CBS domain-containing protein
VVAHMRDHGIRRVPVVQQDGRLVGIITMDDALVWLSRQLDDLGRNIEEVISTARSRRHPLGRLFGH